MKCNQCGSENADDSGFCSKCGASLQPSPTPAPVNPPTTIASGFNNLNAAVQTKKNPAHTILIIECIVGALVAIGLAVLAIWFINSRSGGTQVLSCTQDGKAVTQSTALTYDKKGLTKLEYTLLLDGTVDEDDLSTSDQESLFAAAFLSMALAEYEGHEGIDYYYSEKPTLTTVSLTADLTKTNKTDTDELTEDFQGLTMDEIKTVYTKNGYTCSAK